MVEAVTPPNPADPSDSSRTVPDPTLLTIDSIRREITMLENLFATRLDAAEELNQERFHSVDQLMERGEDQRKEQKQDTKQAVDAALQSQIEATQKMEKSISDQLNSLRTNFDTAIGGVTSSIADLKTRMTKFESVREGAVEQKDEGRQVVSGVYAAIGIAVTLILSVLTVIGFMT